MTLKLHVLLSVAVFAPLALLPACAATSGSDTGTDVAGPGPDTPLTERDAAIDALVGAAPVRVMTMESEVAGMPELRVRVYEPGQDRGWYTFVTSGLSDARMHLPAHVPRELGRAELIVYAERDDPRMPQLLLSVAQFPFVDRTWIGYFHTIAEFAMLGLEAPETLRRVFTEELPPGDPLRERLTSVSMRHVLLLPSILEAHQHPEGFTSVAGEPVHLLAVQAISEVERAIKVRFGRSAILNTLDQQKVDHLLRPERRTSEAWVRFASGEGPHPGL